ncbi:iron ABC transporter permease [Nocardioides sp. cx-173]|uniref:ABC transporter permease n=1 Tax=Nocardioides sp. cx-173 TaxID=2898796 RepID=UPI001E46771E|nr:iron ABC transporter permease [Nocardioides sp. cx-173]MCD4525139.1 iron ABC transporter permease [Nocardioides sp. cx-173]UGB40158.1 iron ABC transporter permease [Nocardioides sp. cx-173]
MTALLERPPVDPAPPAGRSATRTQRLTQLRPSRPIAFLLLFGLVLYPTALIVIASFITDGTPLPDVGTDWAPTMGHLREVLTSRAALQALWNSISLAALSTVFGVAVGGLLAWLAARTDIPMPRLAAFSGIIPMLIPALVGAIAWSFLGAPEVGYIPLLLEQIGIDWSFSMYSYWGMLFVYSLYNVPLAFVFLYGALRLTNPEMEDAANVHGATRWRTMRSVTFPLVKPAMLSAVLLNFVSTVEDFPVAMILGYANRIETLAARIFVMEGQAPPPVNDNAAQAVLLMIVVVVLVTYQRRLLKGRSYATVTGKGMQHRKVALGRVGRPLALVFVLGYMFLAVGLPMLALLMGSLRPTLYVPDFKALLDPEEFTTDSLTSALSDEHMWQVAGNSFMIALAVAVIGVALAVLVAYATRDQNSRVARLLTQVAMLPAAIPGVVLGLGMLWAYVILPVTIYGTLAILIVACVARLLPISTSSVSAAMAGIHVDLEDAATVSGAGRVRAVWWVTVPLLRTGLVSTGVVLFIMATREISMSIFLYTPGTETFAVYLYLLWANGTWSQLASMSFIFAVFTLILVLLTRRWIAESSAR